MKKTVLFLSIAVFAVACQPGNSTQLSQDTADSVSAEEASMSSMIEAVLEQADRELPQFVTHDDVALHAEPTDCWVQIRTRVYNFSPFFEQGGDEFSDLALLCGGDANTLYDSGSLPEDIGEFYVADLLEE